MVYQQEIDMKKLTSACLEWWIQKGYDVEEATTKRREFQQKAANGKLEKSKARILDTKQWNSWTLVEPAEFSYKSHGKTNKATLSVKVKCQCGTEQIVSTYNLTSGWSKACRGCYHRGNKSTQWAGYKDLSGSKIGKIKKGAKERDIEYSLTTEFIHELFEKQHRKCAISGVDLDWKDASLDRIDSTRAYSPDNVQWVHSKVNMMKGSLEESEFRMWCSMIHNTAVIEETDGK